MRSPTLHVCGGISSVRYRLGLLVFVASGCGAVGSEDCQWQSARELSDESCAFSREILGSRNVTARLG